MQSILIYGGIAVNIIGALLLMAFAIMAWRKYKDAGNLDKKKAEIRAWLASRRMICFGLMLGGALIVLAACYIP